MAAKKLKALYRLLHLDLAVAFLCRFVWRCIDRRKVVFANWIGGGCRCNLKYIAFGVRARIPDADIVWLVDPAAVDPIGEFPAGTRLVPYGGLKALRELATCCVWVNNAVNGYYINEGFRKKPGQTYIQTWHGSLGIKRIGFDYREGQSINAYRRTIRGKDAAMLDYLITNSEFEAEIFRRQWYGRGEMKYFGHPRNDILFSPEREGLLRKVRQRYGIPEGRRLVLFAPTFRESKNAKREAFDYALRQSDLLASLAARFGGEWAFLVRYHINDRRLRDGIPEPEGVIDATDYPDMQELMVATDVLVTDYSSCIYDFVFTGRPGFIYARDLEEYDTIRGFYYPIETTPFPIARTSEALCAAVRAFDEAKYRAGVEAFLKGKGCVEDGHATERVVDLIAGLLAEPTAGARESREGGVCR